MPFAIRIAEIRAELGIPSRLKGVFLVADTSEFITHTVETLVPSPSLILVESVDRDLILQLNGWG